MTIYFLRHGDYAKKPGVRDADCPLSEQGSAQMEREAATAAVLGIRADLILASPLLRARQTAEIFARGLECGSAPIADARLSPGFDAKGLADILVEHGELSALLLVGHMPDFAGVIAACIGGGRVEMRKGSLARVDIEGPGSLAGTLAALLTPDSLDR